MKPYRTPIEPIMRSLLKPLVFLACLAPAAIMAWDAFTGGLQADPIADLTNRTGIWSLRLLLVTLAITPVRRLTGWNWLLRVRRMLGLYAFFYGAVHLAIYLGLNQTLDPGLILHDLNHPFILVGYLSLALMIPLAATSTDRMMRRLGRRWQTLHRLVYPVAILAVLHYLLLVKIDFQPPVIYGLILGLLLGYRLWYWGNQRIKAWRPDFHSPANRSGSA